MKRTQALSVVAIGPASTLALVTLLGTQHAHANLVGSWTVGTGAHESTVQIQFGNGNTYLYGVRYDGVETGQGLFEIIAAAQPGNFSFEVISFSFGDALFGITIGADSASGFGNPPAYLDYWHYWTRSDAASVWDESFIGFGDRTVANGSWDGWVFDSASAPNAVPAPAAFALLAGACMARGTRRRVR
jgi:hypothetical protein